MDNNLKKMINEQFSRTLNERKRYVKTRNVVEQMVREELTSQLNEKKNKEAHQLRQLLNDPTLDLAQIAYQNGVPGGTKDGQRSWLSKVARGEITPKHRMANKIIHSIVSGTKS